MSAIVNKKELLYKDFDEFQKSLKFDFNTLNFNSNSICNSLLKLYDHGINYFKAGDDERAYTLLMRFLKDILN